jgi:hypothetical protein
LNVNDVRQAEIHTAGPLVPEPSVFEVKMTTEKLGRHKSPAVDQIPAEWIKTGGGQFTVRFTDFLILFGIRRNCLRSGMSRSLFLFIRRVMIYTVVQVCAR